MIVTMRNGQAIHGKVKQCCVTSNAASKDGSKVRYASIFAKKYGTLVRYAFFVMVRIRYVGTVCFKN